MALLLRAAVALARLVNTNLEDQELFAIWFLLLNVYIILEFELLPHSYCVYSSVIGYSPCFDGHRMENFRLAYIRLCKDHHIDTQECVVEKLRRLVRTMGCCCCFHCSIPHLNTLRVTQYVHPHLYTTGTVHTTIGWELIAYMCNCFQWPHLVGSHTPSLEEGRRWTGFSTIIIIFIHTVESTLYINFFWVIKILIKIKSKQSGIPTTHISCISSSCVLTKWFSHPYDILFLYFRFF